MNAVNDRGYFKCKMQYGVVLYRVLPLGSYRNKEYIVEYNEHMGVNK